MSGRTPLIGEIVHYKDLSVSHFAAIVTGPFVMFAEFPDVELGSVNLRVFDNDPSHNAYLMQGVRHSATGSNAWHFLDECTF